MQQEHLPKDIKHFSRTANTDDDPEILGNPVSNTGHQVQGGEYIDAQNGRPADYGSKGSMKKIKGETILYSNTIPSGGYICIGTASINGHIVELWASPTSGEDSLMRIDGQIMIKSPNFPITYNHPLQIDINENCLGGEIFITDYNVLPMIFNIQDIIDNFNSGSQTYFANFNIDLYVTKVEVSMDQPLFIELVTVGAAGLPPGQYAYSYRYASASGDRTQFGPETPYIPVPNSTGHESAQYPYIKTMGGDLADTPNTSFGIKLKLRIVNPFNYEFIEIRRVSANKAAGLDFLPQPEIIDKVSIGNGEISSIEYIDKNEGIPIAISDSDDTVTQSSLRAAKAIRYYNNRLVLANIKNESRDLINQLTGAPFIVSPNGNLGYPCVEAMGKGGHKDIYNHTYKKSIPSGEKFGWGLLAIDNIGSRSFVIPIENSIGDPKSLRNYQAPNRRDPISNDTQKVSASVAQGGEWKGVVSAENTAFGVSLTHEVFSLDDAVVKSSLDPKNIMGDGTKGSFAGTGFGGNDATDIGYRPFTPRRRGDSDETGHNYKVNVSVNDGSSDHGYAPKGFAPDYFSTGMTIHGIDTSKFPAWVKSVSLVRTKAAGRVICQGIGMYNITPAIPGTRTGSNIVSYTSGAGKLSDTFWFYSPDIDAGILPSAVSQNLGNGNFKVQLVSPLGFFSEVYTDNIDPAGLTTDTGLDMISYARILNDPGNINPGFNTGYTGFGKFRNIRNGAAATGSGNNEYTILNFSPATDTPTNNLNQFFKLQLSADIYATVNQNGDRKDAKSLTEWTEPWYIVNIIADGADVPDNNINNYVDAGHHLKLSSIIGKSTGNDIKCDLVNERWEDCIPNNIGPNGSSENRYAFVRDITGAEKRWINVTYKPSSQILSILNSINSSGYFTDTDGNRSYGVFKSDDINGDWRYFRLKFEYFNNSYPKITQVPDDGSIISVNYDNRVPIKLFTGTHTVGECVFAPIDGSSHSDGAVDNQFLYSSSLPYRKFQFDDGYYIPVDSRDVLLANRIQEQNNVEIGWIRQLLVMFCSENRASIPLAHHRERPSLLSIDMFFPAANYIIRPQIFDAGSPDKNFTDSPGSSPHGGVYTDYKSDYPGEVGMWAYGGFRFRQAVNTNIDYAKFTNDRAFESKPKVGFKENTDFCTRVIWSRTREINIEDAPNLKTFPADNARDLSDKQGDIVYLYDVYTGKGSNLYEICNNGICLTPTEKFTLSDATSGKVGFTSSDKFLAEEIWLVKGVGCPDEKWRGIAEGMVVVQTGEGSVSKYALFFPSKDSIQVFVDEDARDVGKGGKYYKKVQDAILNIGQSFSTKLTGVFNKHNQEYWLQVQDKGTLVYSEKKKGFFGKFTYLFDKYLPTDNQTFGMRGLQTFNLETGNQINGAPIEFFVVQAASQEQPVEKEWVDWEVNSNVAPTLVELSTDADGPVQCSISTFKKYDGFRNFIPRKDAGVSPSRDRLQSRLLVYKIIHNLAGDFKVIDVGVKYKKIK